ncbi:hypothetical protein DFJ73DRAFT_657053 [Zopfochytrium polystomum]|nr:hypothetical protein DFJ73DRAFT_657053 [Zopfochytrium polystomum]
MAQISPQGTGTSSSAAATVSTPPPTALIEAICTYISHQPSRYRVATLFRLERVQVAAITHLMVPADLGRANFGGNLVCLKLLHRHGLLPDWLPSQIIDAASSHGFLDVLDWATDPSSGLTRPGRPRLPYGTATTYAPSRDNRLDVLDWWKQHQPHLELRHSFEAVDAASANGHVAVLQWWKDSGLPLRYSFAAVDDACAYGRIDVLEWWRTKSGVFPRIDYSPYALDRASINGHIDVLRWWREHGGGGGAGTRLEIKYTAAAVDGASERGRIDVLEWWRGESRLPFKHSEMAMELASKAGHLDVLRWWVESSKVKPKFSVRVLIVARDAGRADVLDWWKKSPLAARWSPRKIEAASGKADGADLSVADREWVVAWLKERHTRA